ncbi:MAG: prepilin-type N-terminal cleavage/methylation domain-containing protein [Planctomycetota bacterium]|nr:MAG: prepilin-type N-terminal cleavage/methylation domain-containing protein [Planctomycetota bacterium]
MIRSKRGRAGFTLLELLITVTLAALLMASLTSAFRSTGGTVRTVTTAMNLQVQGNRAMRDILNGLRWADTGSLSVIPAPPFFTSEVQFVQNTGFQDTESSWGPPLEIRYDPVLGEIVWTRHPGLPPERQLDRVRFVAPFYDGEIANGLDDNGNGLVDEPGFCMTREGDVLTLNLTLQGEDSAGIMLTRSFTTRLHCRN